jgi:hypothetical protein
MNWKEEKQRAENSLKLINNWSYTNAMNGSHDWYYKLTIKFSGVKKMCGKVYMMMVVRSLKATETWREVAISLIRNADKAYTSEFEE